MTSRTQFIDNLKNEVEHLKSAVKSHFSNLSDDQLQWKPAKGQWSIAECIEHLVRTNQSYLDRIENQMQYEQSKVETNGEVKHSWLGQQFINMLHPNSKMKLKAFGQMLPSQGITGQEVIKQFIEQQDRMLELLERARDYNINKLKIGSPFLGLLKFRLSDAFKVILVHEQRHLLQAQGVHKTIGFPGRE